MQDLNLLIVFARVVEAGSFSEAARRMGLSRAVVSKAIAKLEQNLNTRLFLRSTRNISLTESGATILQHANRVAIEAEQIEQVAASQLAEPQGVLRVSTPNSFGVHHLTPIISCFLDQYSKIKVDLTISDRLVDMVKDGYDVIIRVTNEPDLDLIAQKIAPVRRILCATPQYFKQWGVPKSPKDLINHNCLDCGFSGGHGFWHFTGPEGDIDVPVSGNLRINNNDALAQAVFYGLGIALLPAYTVSMNVQKGRIQSILSEYLSVDRHIYACYLPSKYLPIKIRIFIDFLKETIGTNPYWNDNPPTMKKLMNR